MQQQLCKMEDMHVCSFVVCVCVNTPPQGKRWMHSLLHSRNSCRCEEPFSHFETLNQTGYIPEMDKGVDSKVHVHL